MATYNKRGYRTPKEKEEQPEATNFAEESTVDTSESTTAEVFSKLDEGSNKIEHWVEKNQKVIFGLVGAIALSTVGYLMYNKFIVEPKEDKAANEMFQAQQFFKQALDATDVKKSDSLFKLSLNGKDGKSGFISLSSEYSGTDAANLSNYFIGIAMLNTGKYAEAINYLEKFSSKDKFLKALAVGAIGDAYSEQNKSTDALEYYLKASEVNKNDLTTPRFLLKAGQTAMVLGKKADALKYFTTIKEDYESSQEASTIDGLIGRVQ